MDFHGICDYINKKHPVRFKREQKDSFSVYLSRLFVHTGYDSDRVSIIKMHDSVENNNIVVGDPKKAEYFVTAHYDTPGKIGFLTASAKYVGKTLAWVVLFAVILVLAFAFAFVLTTTVSDLEYMTRFWLCLAWLVLIAVILFVIPALTANKNNQNASSGLFTVIAMADKIAADPELKEKVCLIIFDNSEWGALGSSAFAKWCKKKGIDLSEKKVFCLDYLGGDGNITLTHIGKKNETNAAFDLLSGTLSEGNTPFETLNGNSLSVGDYMQFKQSVAVSKMCRSKLRPLYIPNLATKKDTQCNLDYLADFGSAMCAMLSGKDAAALFNGCQNAPANEQTDALQKNTPSDR